VPANWEQKTPDWHAQKELQQFRIYNGEVNVFRLVFRFGKIRRNKLLNVFVEGGLLVEQHLNANGLHVDGPLQGFQ
jgi:hypothetical protein